MAWFFGRRKKQDFQEGDVAELLKSQPVQPSKDMKSVDFDRVIVHVCEITPGGYPIKVAELKLKLRVEGEEKTPYLKYFNNKIYIQPSELLLRADGVKEAWVLREGKGSLVPYSPLFLTKENVKKDFLERAGESLLAFKKMTINEKIIYKESLKRLMQKYRWWQPLVGSALVFIGMMLAAGIVLFAINKGGGSFNHGVELLSANLKTFLQNVTTTTQQVVPVGGGG